MKKITSVMMVLLLTLSINIGCSALSGPEKKPQAEQTKSSSSEQMRSDPETAGQIKQIAQKVKGVDKATAVIINKDTSVALKVSGFNRLHLKQIKEEVHEEIKSAVAGDSQIHITTDKKLFAEIQKLEHRLNTGERESDKDMIDIKNKLSKINEDMEG